MKSVNQFIHRVLPITAVLCLGSASLWAAPAPTVEQSTAATYTVAEAKYLTLRLDVPNTRGALTPVAVYVPKNMTGPYPTIVFCHGNVSKKENFTRLMQSLANAGVLCVALDFPGCGESKEDYLQNTIANMVDDTNTVRQYVENHYAVDPTRLGIVGHSMGGRVVATILGTGTSPYILAVEDAPFIGNGTYWLPQTLGGWEGYQHIYALAKRDGFWQVPGWNIRYSLAWFDQLFSSGSSPTENLKNYHGAMLLVYGGKDTWVPPATALQLKESAIQCDTLYLPEAGHALGLDYQESVADDLVKQHVEGVTQWVAQRWSLRP